MIGVVAVPSGTVTFLFTDIEGSTRLWDQHPEAMRSALEAHDAILRAAIDSHGGYVFATGGDGFCVAFQRAGDAIRAVLEAQQALRVQVWPEPADLRVRMGLHIGEASERGGDYFGSPVNRVARLMGMACGGQVLVSAATASLVVDSLPAGAGLVDLGVHDLRGLERAERLFQLNPPGDVELFELLGRSGLGNLPTPVTSFVGQSLEVKRLSGELPRRRLVTLTGVGGVGKTRLGLEAAWAARDDFDAGVWMVELAPIVEPDAVVHAVAAVLRVEPRAGLGLADAIVEALAGRRLLLIVDNCEHVLGAVDRLLSQIMVSCSTVTVLATSREPLGIAGERIVAVRSLDPRLEAVELFCDRAEAADEGFSPSGEELAVIGQICARLDGIPLAVELAAARARTMSLSEIQRRLGDRFRLLRGSGRGGVERHQTLRATVAWSHQLLDPVERAMFDRCAVFAGSFDERAVEAVCADERSDSADVVDVVGSLVDKNMLVADRRRVDTRYRLLETMRQYGEEQLGDALAVYRGRHLRHYTTVAGELDRRLQGSDLGGGIAGLRVELDNLRAAAQWAIATADPIAEALVRATMTFAQVGMVPEIGAWFDQILAALDDPSPYVYGSASLLAMSFHADYERGAELARAGMARASGPDDPETADCWCALSTAAARSGGDVVAVVEALERSVPLYIAAGNRVHAVMILTILALTEDATAATGRAEVAARLAAGLDSQLANVCVAIATGAAAWKRGEATVAVPALRGAFDQVVADDVRGNVKVMLLIMLGVALADDPLAMNDAGSFLAGSLRGMQADGYQSGVLFGLWVAGLYLAASGRLEPAAVVLSYVDGVGFRPIHGAAQQQRADETIHADPRQLEWRARGTGLSRDNALNFIIDALETAEQNSP